MRDPLHLLSDDDFDDLAQGRLSSDQLDELRRRVQVVLDNPDDGVSHDEVWAGLEERMKRARSRAA